MGWRTTGSVIAGALLLAGCALPGRPPALLPVTAPAAPAPAPDPARPTAAPITIVVAVGGLAPADLGTGATPVLARLAAAGVQAPLRPSFPTTTVANLHTLVTGLRPDRHGVIAPGMRDPQRPEAAFTRDGTDGFWWDEAEPLWVAAENAGVPVAVNGWPGASALVRGVRPGDVAPAVRGQSAGAQIAQLVEWLRRPVVRRPRLVRVGLDQWNDAARRHGTRSRQAAAALADIDAAIGQVAAEAAVPERLANLVIVSDHGLAPVDPSRVLAPPPGTISVAGATGFVQGPATTAERLRLSHVTCWARRALPARFDLGRHRRVAPRVCLADSGWTIRDVRSPRAAAGRDPDDAAMAGVLIAAGPAFAAAGTLPRIDNVAVYPLLRHLIGLPPAAHRIDGNPGPFAAVLKDR